MDYVIPLIGEAWDHRRRRRRRVSLLAATLLALAVLTAVFVSGLVRKTPSSVIGLRIPSGTIELTPSAAFSQSPYMGVHCSIPNSISCDEVGLAIWLRHPAYSVEASIAGAPFPLNWLGDERRLGYLSRPRRAFDGYLHPAGIVSRLHVQALSGGMWYGSGTPLPMVWVLINYGDGQLAVTHLRVPLNTGWG